MPRDGRPPVRSESCFLSGDPAGRPGRNERRQHPGAAFSAPLHKYKYNKGVSANDAPRAAPQSPLAVGVRRECRAGAETPLIFNSQTGCLPGEAEAAAGPRAGRGEREGSGEGQGEERRQKRGWRVELSSGDQAG